MAANRGCAAGRVASSCLGASRNARSHSPSFSSSKVVAAKAACTDRHAVRVPLVCGVESAARPWSAAQVAHEKFECLRRRQQDAHACEREACAAGARAGVSTRIERRRP